MKTFIITEEEKNALTEYLSATFIHSQIEGAVAMLRRLPAQPVQEEKVVDIKKKTATNKA